ncbi:MULTISPECIES: hypothetical protein [unclassified Siphonobacter]|uniref:hypothetical protein n=1 Tax=unclassified Siphonobacter TaxID=2635712 RepID=UPI0027880E13|nr:MULTISPECIES: hypothetical protein [unclassified Siphonobacter]MDQ1087455.1 hypothetical protein [Siphonobacter sp. SORGH_AS_1065]MDR6193604.1 hypothetical protein [Siphonobacter sp. SORGH_AS_0500]
MKKLLFGLLLITVGCQNSPKQSSSKPQTYFDLKGYVESQIAMLKKTNPVVRKEVSVNEESETLVTPKIDWTKELELFLQADINKPAYTQSYFIDTLSANTVSYRLRQGEHLPIQFLEVIRDEQNRPSKIKATMLEKNYLFESEKILTLESTDGRLSSYQIEGFQQLFIGDPKPFRITTLVQ